MKLKSIFLLGAMIFAGTFTVPSFEAQANPDPDEGATYYDCIDYYDYWGYYLYTECGYYYY